MKKSFFVLMSCFLGASSGYTSEDLEEGKFDLQKNINTTLQNGIPQEKIEEAVRNALSKKNSPEKKEDDLIPLGEIVSLEQNRRFMQTPHPFYFYGNSMNVYSIVRVRKDHYPRAIQHSIRLSYTW